MPVVRATMSDSRVASVASRPSLVLFTVVFCYSLSGYVAWLMGLRRVKSVLPEE